MLESWGCGLYMSFYGTPFLNTGVMLADFHLLGSLPSFREMLNILDKDGAIVDADSLSIRAVILSKNLFLGIDFDSMMSKIDLDRFGIHQIEASPHLVTETQISYF